MSDDLTAFIQCELKYLWGDMAAAHRRAFSGAWSVECEGLGERIKEATALVGPLPYERIGMSFLLGDYRVICRRIGVPFEYPSPEEEDRIARMLTPIARI